jgi:hypothetical protein
MEKRVVNPDWALKSPPRGYSHVVRVDTPNERRDRGDSRKAAQIGAA